MFYVSSYKNDLIGVTDTDDGIEEFYPRDFLDSLDIDIIGYNYEITLGSYYKTIYFKYTLINYDNSIGWVIKALPRENGVYRCKSTFLGIPVICAGSCFEDCEATHLNLRGMDTSNIMDMSDMFSNCNELTDLDLSSFNTSNVVSMRGMFNECTKLRSINMTSFDTSKVENFSEMFSSCESLVDLDISHFNMNNADELDYTFSDCINLRNVVLPKVTYSYSNINAVGLFKSCKSLVSLDLLGFNDNIKEAYDIVDACYNLNVIYTSAEEVVREASLYNRFLIVTPVSFANNSYKVVKYKNEIPKLLLMGYKGVVCCNEI